jgi:hypothetical protein
MIIAKKLINKNYEQNIKTFKMAVLNLYLNGKFSALIIETFSKYI